MIVGGDFLLGGDKDEDSNSDDGSAELRVLAWARGRLDTLLVADWALIFGEARLPTNVLVLNNGAPDIEPAAEPGRD